MSKTANSNGGSMITDSVIYKPFHFPWAVELTCDHEKMSWVEGEVPLGEDVADWKMGKLSSNEMEFVTQILRMFTQADTNVGAYYHNILIPHFKNNELRMMMTSFANREGTHQRAYALLNDTLGLPEGDYAAFLAYSEMREKHEHMLDANPSTRSGLGLALAKGVFNEGVSLFASFVMLLHFQQRGLMKGMCKIVEWSIKDETKHVEGLSKMFRAYCEAFPGVATEKFKKAIYDMARKTVELEDHFIDLTYNSQEIEGLEIEDVKAYIRFIADRRLTQLGLKPNFEVSTNPLPWLDWVVSGTRFTNFFENKVTEYEVDGLTGDWEYNVNRDITIYTRKDCPYCVLAKELLISEGIEYAELDVTDYDKRQEFYDSYGWQGDDRSVPKIFDGTKLIGGYIELKGVLNEI